MMHMIFTDEELDAIVMEPFNWHVKNGTTKKIRKSIERKLKLINGQKITPSHMGEEDG